MKEMLVDNVKCMVQVMTSANVQLRSDYIRNAVTIIKMKMDLLEDKQWQNFGMEQGLFLLPLYDMGIFLHSFVPFQR
jgi:hypothetical protein